MAHSFVALLQTAFDCWLPMQTPAQRLKDDVSTGHAASPVTIVVGKAHMRTNQSIGAAPKIVPNIALFKKDMKMDEDLTGLLNFEENNV